MLQHSFIRNLFIALVLLAGLVFAGALPALAAAQQAGDLVCTGDNLSIPAGQTAGNILAFGCNVTVEKDGIVRGSITDFGGNISIAGTVQGSIATFGGDVILTETAVVEGDIATIGGNYQIAPGAVVRRSTSPLAPPSPPRPFNPFTRTFNFGFDLLGGIVTALAFAALGALVVIIAPDATRRVGDAVQAKPVNTIGVGCLTALVLPILGILLIITLIGIPVAFLLGIAAWAAWIFGGIAIGLLAGEKILGAFKVNNILPVVAVILGIIILMLIGQVPILGWFVSCIVGLIGLGAVVLTRFGTRAYPAPPTMTMLPAAAATGANAPGTFTPSNTDIAAWEAKARAAQTNASATTNAAPAPTDAPVTPSASETKALEPPATETPPATDAGETKSGQ
ncbi:MAG: polymer-forming cytoskeletal protein [Chloroflexi bacterium]|nr:polymer-forming cytoskeletal protein [Chloroflexota bacterium]